MSRPIMVIMLVIGIAALVGAVTISPFMLLLLLLAAALVLVTRNGDLRA